MTLLSGGWGLPFDFFRLRTSVQGKRLSLRLSTWARGSVSIYLSENSLLFRNSETCTKIASKLYVRFLGFHGELEIPLPLGMPTGSGWSPHN